MVILLKGIPKLLSPELMKILLEMGHGDEIVLADGNFPAVTCAQRLVRYDGHYIPELLSTILEFFPLDKYCDNPVGLMQVVSGDSFKPSIWDKYEAIIRKDNTINFKEFGFIERFEFYERAKNAFAVVATSEKELYANIILKKGVVVD
jgi:L-fucose mutarotase